MHRVSMCQKVGLQCIQRRLEVSPRVGFAKDQIGKGRVWAAFRFCKVIKDKPKLENFFEGVLEEGGGIFTVTQTLGAAFSIYFIKHLFI